MSHLCCYLTVDELKNTLYCKFYGNDIESSVSSGMIIRYLDITLFTIPNPCSSFP